MKKGKLLFVKDNGTKVYELDYAKHIFKFNPIRKSEIEQYKGNTKHKPHGIDQKIWKKAYAWAKRTGNFTIDD